MTGPSLAEPPGAGQPDGMDEEEISTSARPGAGAGPLPPPARWVAGLRIRGVALLCVLGALVGAPSGCGGSVDRLEGRWNLVAVDGEPVSRVPPTRLGGSSGTQGDWLEEELVSRSIEIGEGEEEFLDRRVVRRTHVFPPGSIRRSDAPATARVEGVDTLLVAGTLDVDGDTIRFEAEAEADTGNLLVGTRGSEQGGRLQVTTPDGTRLTFEKADDE